MGKIDVGMIEKEFGVIEKANALFENSLEGEALKKSRRVMVDCRRKLKKKKNTLDDNPVAAMYGESQVGKSYLIGSLLSKNGEPFTITGENDTDIHNFIEEINPPGGGNESTSVVSRFSVNYKPVNPNFPVKALMLSSADIVLVLCDSFYNDVQTDNNSRILETEDIVKELNTLKVRWNDRRKEQDIFGEDDVYDMRDYFNDKFSLKANNVIKAGFFDEVSELISKAKPDEWKDIFSLLWNRNEKFTSLFDALIREYGKLKFFDTVYLPLETVLYKYGTLLDVKRLKEIYAAPLKIESNYTPDTKVLLPDGGEVAGFHKSYLCVLTAELSFCLQEKVREGKPFLNEIDLLDFPGARARMTLPENKVSDENIPELLIRGKVAYLFNKYSDAEKISIFMLCAKHDQTTQRSMSEMLNNWINKFIGDTPEKRKNFIKNSKISPLFIIGTFFNVNLEYNPRQDRKDNISSLDYRWNQRFERTLSAELINAGTYQWFNNWTDPENGFKNIFLLRDFVYSESKSQIFKGFLKDKKETEEINPPDYPDLREKLRQSFLEYPFVQRHFENPAESWDGAATMNNDGTRLIIEKLTVAAENINIARIEKNRNELNEISQTILTELKKYFHSDDKDETLQKAKSTVGEIQLKMANAFDGDGIKLFGPMMKELMLDEKAVWQLYHDILEDIEHRSQRNESKGTIIEMQVPPEKSDTVDTYFKRVCAYYSFSPEKGRAYLEENGIDLEALLRGVYKIKDNARILAEKLLDYWLDRMRTVKHPVTWRVLSEGNRQNPQDPPILLLDIANMYKQLFEKLDIAERIAEKILRYTNMPSRAGMPYKIIADISAEYINKFVNTVGFEHLDVSAINALRQADDNMGKGGALGLKFDRDVDPSEQSVEELFTKIHNLAKIVNENPKELETLPSYRNYLLWSDRLKIGFIYACDIPTYDAATNKKLGDIIKECETVGKY